MQLTAYIQNFFFLLLLLWCGRAVAQEYTIHVNHYGEEEGLGYRDVVDLYEDTNGIIWIATRNGIQSFDGENFKDWDSNSPSVDLSDIVSIWQDAEGWMWLYSIRIKDFQFLNPATNQVLSAQERFGYDYPVRGREILRQPHFNYSGSRFLENSKGQFFIVNENPNELIVYHPNSTFEVVKLDRLPKMPLELYHIDAEDRLWLKTKTGNNTSGQIWYQINESGRILHEINVYENYELPPLPKSDLAMLHFYFHGNFKNKSGEVRQCFGKLKWEISKDKWEAFDFNNFDTPVLSLDPTEFHDNIFPDERVLLEDSRGMLWVGGRWGLSQVIARPNLFENYMSEDKQEEGSFSRAVRGVFEDNGYIYINLEFSGLMKVEKGNPLNWEYVYQPEKNYSSPAMIPISDGRIATAHSDGTLRLVSLDGKVERFTFHPDEKIPQRGIYCLYEDNEKRIWCGLSTGELAIKRPGEKYVRCIASNEVFDVENSNSTSFIADAQNGKIWIGGYDKLYLFDTRSMRYLNMYSHNESGSNYLPASQIHGVQIEGDGTFWLASNRGLIKWDKDKGEHRLFNKADGFSSDIIYGMMEDGNDNLWLMSNRGLMQFNKKTYQINTYLEKDGLPHNEFNRRSISKNKEGRIYFGTLNGVTSFQPDDFYKKDDTVSPPLFLTKFEIFDGRQEKLLDKTVELNKNKNIIFYHGDRFFRMNFNLLTYDDVRNINYAWKIKGIDEDWNYQKESTLQIGKLPYGSHILQIKGQDSKGYWSPNELTFNVDVIRPFYLRPWFIALSILFLSGGIFLFLKRRTHNFLKTQKLLETEIAKATSQIQSDKTTIEKQADELRQLDKAKSRFFANVSHELRTPLTLILGPIGSALKSGTLDNRNFTHLKKAQQNGKELLKLVASILDLSKMESGKLEVQEKPELLFPLVRRIASAFESHAQRSGIEFTFDYQAEKDLQLQLDREKVETILNNLLSNAIKFTTPGGTILVKTEDFAHSICLSVADSGRGIHPDDLPHVFDRFYQSGQPNAPAEGGTGIGLALCQELVKMMDGKIWVESGLGKGSTFFVELPRREVLGAVPKPLSPPAPKGEHLPAAYLQKLETSTFSTGFQVATVKGGSSPLGAGGEGRPTILIVEDNHSLRDYIESILSPYYHIIKAENGKAALELLSESGEPSIVHRLPSIILSDIMMPVMDGFQLLEKLKSDDRYRHLPVIMLTARADMRDKLKALRIGVDDYLLKPFDEEELLVRIENLLQNQEERKVATELSSKDDNSNGAERHPAPEGRELISSEDAEWLEGLEAQLRQHLSDSQYSISMLAHDAAVSERQLRRRIKQLTGLSPVQYFKEIRLQEARMLLENRQFKTVVQTASAVGFQDAGAFSRNFSKRFGKMPSEYIIN